MSNGYTGSDSANEAEAIHIEDSLALNRALRQVNNNSTGICEECDEAIPEARLALVPMARYCVCCQSQKDGSGPRVILRNVYVP